MIREKYRVEERYADCSTYLLHGIYNNLQSAVNKKNKLLKSGIKIENLSIIKETTIVKREIMVEGCF